MNNMGVLPCGIDKLVILKAYEDVLSRAQTLDERYHKSPFPVVPQRNLIVTGVPGFGKMVLWI